MIKRIVIVGGGSAGWMTASYLTRALPDVQITLVESSRIPPVSVGEATFSTIKLFFDFLGLEEHEWMPSCKATYKMAIRFVDWRNQKHHFYHPFQRFETANGMSGGEWWLKLLRDETPFDYACFTTPWLCDGMRSPKYLDGTVFDDKVHDYFTEHSPPPNSVLSGHEVQYPYAYHLNAAELATYLAGYAMERGVTRVLDDVVDARVDENGYIAAIHTQEHGAFEADLFVDCTGFGGLLINKTLREPFVPFHDSLLNDSAVAIQVPRDSQKHGVRPYTTAQTQSAGWAWNIPLYDRDGTGYVYSSQFIDADEAEREFRELLGPGADDYPAQHIQMRIGRCRNSWVKNCVAIGLSSGFVEPLESTGIFFIQHSIEELVNHIPASRIPDENMIASYNTVINDCIDGIREFLTIHYYASERTDTPYWRATKEITPTEGIRERMRLWNARLPNGGTIFPWFHGFESYSWAVILLGVGYEPRSYLPILDQMDPSEAQRMFHAVREQARHLVETLPSQYEYLTHMYARS